MDVGQGTDIVENLVEVVEGQAGNEVGMGDHIVETAEEAEAIESIGEFAYTAADTENVVVQTLDAGFDMEHAMGHGEELGLELIAEQGGMDLEMEADVGVLAEEAEQGQGMAEIEIEGTVEHTDVLDAMGIDKVDAMTDGIDIEIAYRLLASADAEGTGVEAATGGLELDKGFVPVEELAGFGGNKLVELEDAGNATIDVLAIGVDIADAGEGVPLVGLIPHS